jgi:hypothetical protein
MPETLRSKVERWLGVLHCTPVEIEDAEANWHLQFNYPSRTQHVMHVVSPKLSEQSIVIASAVNVSPEHLEGFAELDAESQADFAWELRKTLNVIDVDFMLDGLKHENDCPPRFQLTVTRYEDGLTLDSFARSIGAVYKTELNSILLIRRLLGAKGFGDGGRFDFKKLGL